MFTVDYSAICFNYVYLTSDLHQCVVTDVQLAHERAKFIETELLVSSSLALKTVAKRMLSL